MASASGRRSRRLFFLLYLSALHALLLLVLLEVGSRVFVGVSGKSLERRAGVRFPTEDYHPFLRTTNAPGPQISTNPEFYGWRILPPGADVLDMGRTRVFFLGGSTTASRYPEFTVNLLNERGIPTIGFNAGAPMHTSLQALYKLWTYVDWVKPDLVIVLQNVNDIAHGFTAPAHALPEYRPDYSHTTLGQHLVWHVGASEFDRRPVFVASPRPDYANLLEERDDSLGGLARLVLAKSTFLRLAGTGPERLELETPARSEPMEPEVYLRALPAFRRNLTNIRLSCEALRVPVVFLTMPTTVQGAERVFVTRNQVLTNDGETYLSDEDFLAAAAAFNAAVLELGEEGVAWVLDVARHITAPELFSDEVHLKPPGLRQEADLVAKFLVKEGLVPAKR